MLCHLEDLVLKGIVSALLLSPLDHLLWAKPAARAGAQSSTWGRSSHGEELRSPANKRACQAFEGVTWRWILQSVKPSGDSNTGQHLDYNPMRDLKPELPRKATPRFPTHRNHEKIFIDVSLNYRVTCYTAITNAHTLWPGNSIPGYIVKRNVYMQSEKQMCKNSHSSTNR